MKPIRVTIFLLIVSIHLAAQQKSLIDTTLVQDLNWPSLGTGEGGITISRDGRYVAYIINNRPVGKSSLIIQSLFENWKEICICIHPRLLFFSSNKRFYWQEGDSVWMRKVGGDQSKRLVGVSSTISYPRSATGEWIAFSGNDYGSFKLLNLVNDKQRNFVDIKSHRWLIGGNKVLLTTANGDLKLLDLTAGKELSFSNVKDYVLSPNEKSIVLLTEIGNTKSLKWSNLNEEAPSMIWTGHEIEQPGGYVFNKAGNQFAFNVESPDGRVAIWYYRKGEIHANLKVNDQMTGLDELRLSGVRGISENGNWLFFNVRKKLSFLPDEAITAQVDIWSYRDEVLNPAQTGENPTFHDYVAVEELNTGRIQLLEQHEDERLGSMLGDYVLMVKGRNEAGAWWPHGGPISHWLISLKDGIRTLIKQNSNDLKAGIMLSVSPESKWIIYWDPELKHYFSMNPQTGERTNLTVNIPSNMEEDIEQLVRPAPVGIAGWYTGDSSVLIYDNYDIWKVDPSGIKTPTNITGGYGKEYGIKLRLVYGYREDMHLGQDELLSGYDVMSKYNGFFRCYLDKPGAPEILTMGPYNYYQIAITKQIFNSSLQPMSSGQGKNKRWLVMRQSSTEYPNFYVSKDLKDFTPLTDLQPQKAYNWLTTEAVSWKMYNGQINTGVLYKPENFDPNKKYPIIFNYYEKYSQRCYEFPLPTLTKSNINIPWFVSRGYLVFTPDIQYAVASTPGGMTICEAATNAVASAAEYLARRSYVDKSRMGIQGHSFGGHETNGIVTYSSLFAAAAEVAGYSDHISAYLTLVTADENSSIEKEHKIDHFNQRMGATPWERPDLFRRNSPVQNADKVTTPLLITHNKKDGSVNFNQGVEMYMALRRLGNPCWLLQYDNSGHVLGNKKDALDYTIRLTQYFDHYLKGSPAPQWMTRNTLAQYKNKNNLYELDPKGNCGKDCKVCKEWNAKVDSSSLHFPRNDAERDARNDGNK